MENWFVFVLISLGALTLAEIFQKVAISDEVDAAVETGNLLNWLLMAILAALVLIFWGIPFEISWTLVEWGLFGISSLIYFWAGTFCYRSYKGNSPTLQISCCPFLL
ncbi:hypothetical protein GF357_03060 [Candidatus Dojkabacteria bacterium]|nr:hypothetical protein [Candidatus Dojkabacteria bacterium]